MKEKIFLECFLNYLNNSDSFFDILKNEVILKSFGKWKSIHYNMLGGVTVK